MIIFITSLVTFLTFLIAAIVKKEDGGYDMWCRKYTYIILAIVLGFCLFGMSIRIPLKKNIEYSIAEYENLKEQAEGLTREDLVDLDVLREEILSMNNKIDKNRIYCESPWCGVWFSEEIGNLQKLTYTGLRK